MRKIKVTAERRDEIEAALKKNQGRAKVRVIDFEDLIELASRIEEKVEKLLYKKDRAGLTFSANYYAQSFPNSYDYRPESTWIDFAYGKGGDLYITKIYRNRCTTTFCRTSGLGDKADALRVHAERFLSREVA